MPRADTYNGCVYVFGAPPFPRARLSSIPPHVRSNRARPDPVRASPPSDPHPMAAEPAADDHDPRPPPADGPAVAGGGDASASAAADALMSPASEQLTMVYQGDVFVFDPVPPQKVAPLAPSRIPSPQLVSPHWSRDAALTCCGLSQLLLPLDGPRRRRILPAGICVLSANIFLVSGGAGLLSCT